MTNPYFLAIFSVVLISLVSLMGAFTLSIKRQKLNNILIYLVSFAVGALFGDAFIHLIPESFAKLGNISSFYILFGLVLFFILEKLIHWRHCHKNDCDEHSRSITAMNLVGDGMHNFLDGLLIGASYLVSLPVGVSTTLAVMAHEIPQEIGDFGVLLHGGFTIKKALWFNFLSALMAMLGLFLSLMLGAKVEGYALILLPITAGGFIYIAGSDLIPELHHDLDFSKAVKQLAAILFGIGAMFLLTWLE